MIIVGDSLNRNMWESLACLLYSSIPNPSSEAHVQETNGFYKVIRAKVRGLFHHICLFSEYFNSTSVYLFFFFFFFKRNQCLSLIALHKPLYDS